MGPEANETCSIARGKNDNTEAVLLWAPLEKAGFLEKIIMLGKKKAAGKGEDHMCKHGPKVWVRMEDAKPEV